MRRLPGEPGGGLQRVRLRGGLPVTVSCPGAGTGAGCGPR